MPEAAAVPVVVWLNLYVVLWFWFWSLVVALIVATPGRKPEGFVAALLLGPFGAIVAACLRPEPPAPLEARPVSPQDWPPAP